MVGNVAFHIFSNIWTHVHRIECPPFIPNDYLFETHKDKGKEKWEIFAWAVRDIMAKESGLEKDDVSTYEDKCEYMRGIGTMRKKKAPAPTTTSTPKEKAE